eukprot:jgi/Mesvir1/17072/Mv15260-RA.1
MNGAGIATYVVCIFALVFCAVVSVWYTKFRSKKVVTADDFVTARGTASTWYIGWSFFATAVGSWIIVGPASYAPWAGIIGVVFYAVATGIPVLLIAALGAVIQRRHPHIVSLSDFIGKRWGYSAQTGVVILTLFNMGVGMTAEYTTIGALFKDFVGGKATPIIIIVGVLTMAYSAYGGLAVSIFTDQIQAIASLLLLFILVLYVAITLPGEKLGKLPEYLEGTNEVGYSSMFVMPASLCAATIFSEMFWQRVWASQDAHALKWGSIIGCTALIIMTFLLGFGGFLAAWAGFISWETTNPNLYLFQVFNQERDMDGNARVSSWVGVLTMLMAVIMNESALDSIQNGLVAAVSGQFLSKYHVNWSRAVCVLFNIPLMIIGTQQTLKVLSLFLITNMLTSCAAIPVAFALYKGRGHEYITGGGTIFSFFCGFICVSAYGISQTEGDFWDGYVLRPAPRSARSYVLFCAGTGPRVCSLKDMACS